MGQQYLRAGLVDELSIHLVPILLGAGTRMFDNLGDEQIELKQEKAVQGKLATHLHYRVAKPKATGP